GRSERSWTGGIWCPTIWSWPCSSNGWSRRRRASSWTAFRGRWPRPRRSSARCPIVDWTWTRCSASTSIPRRGWRGCPPAQPARRTCRACQRAYNLWTAPPREDESCDDDSTLLVQRDDDRPEVIRRRLRVFEEQTTPVHAFYQDRGLIRPVDAEGTEEEVFER